MGTLHHERSILYQVYQVCNFHLLAHKLFGWLGASFKLYLMIVGFCSNICHCRHHLEKTDTYLRSVPVIGFLTGTSVYCFYSVFASAAC